MRCAALGMVALLVLAGVGGCGQKGPLYLPDRTRRSVPVAPASAPAAAAPATAPAPAPPAASPPAASPDAGR